MRLLLLPLLGLLACGSPAPPERPVSVPSSAVWAGGPDGGAWVDCGRSTKEPVSTWKCKVFFENGNVWADDDYTIVEKRDGVYRPKQGLFHSLDFNSFDGTIIYLTGGDMLVPSSRIDRTGNDPARWTVRLR